MSEYNPKAALRTLRIIYIGVLVMPSLFVIAVLSMNIEEVYIDFTSSDPLLMVLIILAILMIPASIFVPKYQLKQVKSESSLQNKMSVYQTVIIIKSALWVGVANFGAVIFMMSGNIAAILVSVISILIIGTFYPSTKSIESAVRLQPNEINQFSK